MSTPQTSWYVERAGCYAAGPFDTFASADAWIDAQPDKRDLVARAVPEWRGLLDSGHPDQFAVLLAITAATFLVVLILAAALHSC